MANYRDPKVTTTKTRDNMKWVWIAVAVLVGLLLLWWLWPDSEGTDVAPTAETPAGETTPATPPATTQ